MVYLCAGIADELQKLDKLTRRDTLNKTILFPALDYSLERQFITPDEAKILTMAINKGEIKAGDLEAISPGKNNSQRTYQIRKLLEAEFLIPLDEDARIYTVHFTQSYLIRGVIKALRDNGLIGNLD